MRGVESWVDEWAPCTHLHWWKILLKIGCHTHSCRAGPSQHLLPVGVSPTNRASSWTSWHFSLKVMAASTSFMTSYSLSRNSSTWSCRSSRSLRAFSFLDKGSSSLADCESLLANITDSLSEVAHPFPAVRDYFTALSSVTILLFNLDHRVHFNTTRLGVLGEIQQLAAQYLQFWALRHKCFFHKTTVPGFGHHKSWVFHKVKDSARRTQFFKFQIQPQYNAHMPALLTFSILKWRSQCLRA